MKKIVTKYPRQFVLITPRKRDTDTGFVTSWTVLQSLPNVPAAMKALDYYGREGFEGVVAISTFTDEEKNAPELPPNIVAKFWRVFFNTEGGSQDRNC